MLSAFTFASALVPSFLLLGYFRARDVYPEPARVLWATFGLGMLITIPVLILDYPLDLIVKQFHGVYSHGLADAFFTAAIPEEFFKLLVVVFYCSRHKEFDEPMDGIVYGAVAALGFATFENLMYVTEGGVAVAIMRAITAVPGHAFMGAVMGYYVGQARFNANAHAGGRPVLLAKAYIIPVLLHTLYDFPLLSFGNFARMGQKMTDSDTAMVLPLLALTAAVLAFEWIWSVQLVKRLRRHQILIAGPETLAGMRLPYPPPAQEPVSQTVGWLLTIAGGLVATAGGIISLLLVVGLAFGDTKPEERTAVILGGSLIGALPLLVGLVIFVFGVRRVHRSMREEARAPIPSVPSA